MLPGSNKTPCHIATTRTMHEAFITYSNMTELMGRLVV